MILLDGLQQLIMDTLGEVSHVLSLVVLLFGFGGGQGLLVGQFA
ncbi:hypothetical protein ULF88_03755 [Halopseudomonas pachastrellae]|nr:hypothetical protein [Halopseudomonas pachastrellae]